MESAAYNIQERNSNAFHTIPSDSTDQPDFELKTRWESYFVAATFKSARVRRCPRTSPHDHANCGRKKRISGLSWTKWTHNIMRPYIISLESCMVWHHILPPSCETWKTVSLITFHHSYLLAESALLSFRTWASQLLWVKHPIHRPILRAAHSLQVRQVMMISRVVPATNLHRKMIALAPKVVRKLPPNLSQQALATLNL